MPFYPKTATLQIGEKKGWKVKPKVNLAGAVLETSTKEILKLSEVSKLHILGPEYANLLTAQIKALDQQLNTALPFAEKQKILALKHALEQAQKGLKFLSDETMFNVVTNLSHIKFMDLISAESRVNALDNTLNSIIQPMAETISGFLFDVTTPESESSTAGEKRTQAKSEITSAMADIMRFSLCKARPDLKLTLFNDKELEDFILEPGNLSDILVAMEKNPTDWNVTIKDEDYKLYQKSRAWEWFYQNPESIWPMINFQTTGGKLTVPATTFPSYGEKKLSTEIKTEEQEFLAILKQDIAGQQLYMKEKQVLGKAPSPKPDKKKRSLDKLMKEKHEDVHYKTYGLDEKEKAQLDKAMEKNTEIIAQRRFYAAAAQLYSEKRAKETLAKIDKALEDLGVKPAEREFLKLLFTKLIENPKSVAWLKELPVELITVLPQILQIFGVESTQLELLNIAEVMNQLLQKCLPDEKGTVPLLPAKTNQWLAEVLSFQNLQSIPAVADINKIRSPNSAEHIKLEQNLEKVEKQVNAFVDNILPLHDRRAEDIDTSNEAIIEKQKEKPPSKPLTVSKRALVQTIVQLSYNNPLLFEAKVIEPCIDCINKEISAIHANPVFKNRNSAGYQKAGAVAALLEANKKLLITMKDAHFRIIYEYVSAAMAETWEQKDWDKLIHESGRKKYLKNLFQEAALDLITGNAVTALADFMVDFASAGTGLANEQKNASKKKINEALQLFLKKSSDKAEINLDEFFNQHLREPLENAGANKDLMDSLMRSLFKLLEQRKIQKLTPMQQVQILMNPVLRLVGDQDNRILLGHFAIVMQTVEESLHLSPSSFPGLSEDLNTVMMELHERESHAERPTKLGELKNKADKAKEGLRNTHIKMHAFKAHKISTSLKDEVLMLGEHQPLPDALFKELCKTWLRKFETDVVAKKPGMLHKELRRVEIELVENTLKTKYESSEIFLMNLFEFKNDLESVPAARAWLKDVVVQYRAAVEAQKLITPPATPKTVDEQLVADKGLLNQLLLRLDMIATALGGSEKSKLIIDTIFVEDHAAEVANKNMRETLVNLIKTIDETYKKSRTKDLDGLLDVIDKTVQTLIDFPVEDLIKHKVLAGRKEVEMSRLKHRSAEELTSNAILEVANKVLASISQLKTRDGHYNYLIDYNKRLTEVLGNDVELCSVLNNIHREIEGLLLLENLPSKRRDSVVSSSASSSKGSKSSSSKI